MRGGEAGGEAPVNRAVLRGGQRCLSTEMCRGVCRCGRRSHDELADGCAYAVHWDDGWPWLTKVQWLLAFKGTATRRAARDCRGRLNHHPVLLSEDCARAVGSLQIK